MFQKTTLGGKLTAEQISLIEQNYETLFETDKELTNSQIIDKLINKALSMRDNSGEINELKIQAQNFITARAELENKVNEYEEKNELLKKENENFAEKIVKYKAVFSKYVQRINEKFIPVKNKQNKFDFIPNWLYIILLENVKSKKIQNFYNSLKNKNLYKPLNSNNEQENIINLLTNHFLLRMARGYYQPQLSNGKKLIYEAFKQEQK